MTETKIGKHQLIIPLNEEYLLDIENETLFEKIKKSSDNNLPCNIEIIFQNEGLINIPYYIIPLILNDIIIYFINAGYEFNLTENINNDYIITLTYD